MTYRTPSDTVIPAIAFILIVIGFGLEYLKFSRALVIKDCSIIIDGKEYNSKTYPKFKSGQIIKFGIKNTTVEIPFDKEVIIKL